MSNPLTTTSLPGDLEATAAGFYRRVLEALNAAGAPYLVGGAYGLAWVTGIRRNTKDLDIFVRRDDYERVSRTLGAVGYDTEILSDVWLAKARCGEWFVDIIFNSGNGIAPVDDDWFAHAFDADVLGVPVKIAPVEEMIWSKAFIMERERYDGADVAHLLRAAADRMDWQRLLDRFGGHWRVLLSHLVLFGFVYPGERALVPSWLMDQLLERLRAETHSAGAADGDKVCGGTLLSRAQYRHDVEQQGYRDARPEAR